MQHVKLPNRANPKNEHSPPHAASPQTYSSVTIKSIDLILKNGLSLYRPAERMDV
jgi:hypothetical protein